MDSYNKHIISLSLVVIIDPGISTNEDNLPYLAGIKMDAYIRVSVRMT